MVSQMAPIDTVAARAERMQEAADRAFRRWFLGEVTSSAAATRLAGMAEEAWADLRLHPDFQTAGGHDRWPGA